jgi:tripartite-type tricarboxylate transporter receptor subunit TctC
VAAGDEGRWHALNPNTTGNPEHPDSKADSMQDQLTPKGQQRRAFQLSLAALLAAPAFSSRAESKYPSRPVKIVVPYSPGGGPDVLMRQAAPKLSEILGQPVVVDNIVGAGGILAAQSVARAAPDGYTLMIGSSTHVTQKAMQPSVKFDPVKDFVHIIRYGVIPQLLVVPASSPIKSVQDLVAAIRKDPGKLNYASGGIGSAAHLAGAAMMHSLNLQALHVPYRGSAEIITSLVSGATQFAFPVAATAMGPVQQGQLRALATTGSKRLPALPQLPTLREATGKDELVIETWGGYWAPAGTPPAVVDVLFKAFQKLYADPALRADAEAAGNIVSLSSSPAEFTKMVADEMTKYERLVKAVGLTAQ